MYRDCLVGTALMIAIYCLVYFISKTAVFAKTNVDQIPKLSLLFLVKNQQDVIEGLIRKAFAETYSQNVEIVAIDFGSTDQTKLILQRLADNVSILRFVQLSEGQINSTIALSFCRGKKIYCFDLTRSINYGLMIQMIHTVVGEKHENGLTSGV